MTFNQNPKNNKNKYYYPQMPSPMIMPSSMMIPPPLPMMMMPPIPMPPMPPMIMPPPMMMPPSPQSRTFYQSTTSTPSPSPSPSLVFEKSENKDKLLELPSTKPIDDISSSFNSIISPNMPNYMIDNLYKTGKTFFPPHQKFYYSQDTNSIVNTYEHPAFFNEPKNENKKVYIEYAPYDLVLEEECQSTCPHKKTPALCAKNHKIGIRPIKSGDIIPEHMCHYERPWRLFKNSPLYCTNINCWYSHLKGRTERVKRIINASILIV